MCGEYRRRIRVAVMASTASRELGVWGGSMGIAEKRGNRGAEGG